MISQTENSSVLVKQRNKAGLKSFCFVYLIGCKKQFLNSLRCSSCLTLFLLILYCFSSVNGYELLGIVADLCLRVSPAVLGFTLSGYAIVVNVTDKRLQKKLKKTMLDNSISMYQRLYTTFVAMLLSMFTAMLVGVMTKVLLSFNFQYEGCDKVIVYWIDILNGFSFIFITFILSYALFSVKDIISNLYSLGQVAKNLSVDDIN